MKDLVSIQLQAGGGGHGRVSFLREKSRPKGGPDGGTGGDGGDIVLRASGTYSTLLHLSGVKVIRAEKGEDGGGRQLHGKAIDPLVVEVPVGTVVWQVAQNPAAAHRQALNHCQGKLSRSNVTMVEYAHAYVGAARPVPPHEHLSPELYAQLQQQLKRRPIRELPLEQLAILDHAGAELLICQGGFGGQGNTTFKNSTEQTPLRAQWGYPGEERLLVLELKLLADVGLVGLPNAGKSTLLSALTQARPKIADYPFTTLEPQLGVLIFDPSPLGRHQASQLHSMTTSPESTHSESTGANAVSVGTNRHDLVLADLPGIIAGASTGKGLGVDFLRHVEHCVQLLVVVSVSAELLSQHTEPSQLAQALMDQLTVVRQELRSYHPDLLSKPQQILINKCDLLSSTQRAAIFAIFTELRIEVLFTSGATHEGLPLLVERLRTI